MYNEMAGFSCKIPDGFFSFFSFLAAYLELIFKILKLLFLA